MSNAKVTVSWQRFRDIVHVVTRHDRRRRRAATTLRRRVEPCADGQFSSRNVYQKVHTVQIYNIIVYD